MLPRKSEQAREGRRVGGREGTGGGVARKLEVGERAEARIEQRISPVIVAGV